MLCPYPCPVHALNFKLVHTIESPGARIEHGIAEVRAEVVSAGAEPFSFCTWAPWSSLAPLRI